MTEQKEARAFQVLKIKAYERKCTKKAVVSVKVAAKYPMPKYIVLHFKFKDGSEKFAVARFISMYKNYAYYFLRAAHARKVAPLLNEIQEVMAYELQ